MDFPDEDWVFEVCPELNNLEFDTFDALLAQAQQHAKYERAARELLLAERAKLEKAHENDPRSVRAQLESDMERREKSTELRVKGLEEGAQEELEELRTEAQDKIQELEGAIEELEEKNEAQEKRIAEIEAQAEEECAQLREENEVMRAKLEEAQQETDLKRQTSRKLKEEIIDNDRLTVANLNRIKLLEALLEQHAAALAESEEENETLKAELGKTLEMVQKTRRPRMRLPLCARCWLSESQLMSLSQRLSERENATRDIYGGGASETAGATHPWTGCPSRPFLRMHDRTAARQQPEVVMWVHGVGKSDMARARRGVMGRRGCWSTSLL